MKASEFDCVLDDILNFWSRKDGLIGLVEEPKDTGIRICIGINNNSGILPEHCRVFSGDDMLYDGPIAGKAGLTHVLKKHNVKQIMWTTAVDMDKRCKARREHGRTRIGDA